MAGICYMQRVIITIRTSNINQWHMQCTYHAMYASFMCSVNFQVAKIPSLLVLLLKGPSQNLCLGTQIPGFITDPSLSHSRTASFVSVRST